MNKKKQRILWETVYVLGIEDDRVPDRDPESGVDVIHVVITGIKPKDVPYWNQPVPQCAEIHRVPRKKTPREYASELGGVPAFGWHFKDGFRRSNRIDGSVTAMARKFNKTFFKSK